jgi:hypothetical protein
MIKLDDLRPNATVCGLLPNAPPTVVGARWFGSDSLELTPRLATGAAPTWSSTGMTRRDWTS